MLLMTRRGRRRFTVLGLNDGMGESDYDGLLGETDAELALERANDELRFNALAGREELLDDAYLARLGLRRAEVSVEKQVHRKPTSTYRVARALGDLGKLGKNVLDCERLRLEHGRLALARVLREAPHCELVDQHTREKREETDHGDKSEITLLLEVSLDGREGATGTLGDGLHQERLADAELEPHVVRAELVESHGE